MDYWTMQFDELLARFENALTEKGLGYSSRLDSLKVAARIVKMHESSGYNGLNGGIFTNYLLEIDERLYAGKISSDRHRLYLLYFRRFSDFCKNGEIDTTYSHNGSRHTLTTEYERIASDFLSSGNFHPNTKNDMRWVSHKYFTWLNENGFEDLSDVAAPQIQKFMLDCSKKHPPNSLANIRLYLKKLYVFLYETGQAQSTYADLLSLRICTETKIKRALPMNDVEKLLGTIDRSTKNGKRAYAIMCLGSELGVRASDVINLKLTDVDWQLGEIRIVQSKTGVGAALPLTEKLGLALHDYILNARPKANHAHVFMRVHKPHTPLKSAITVGEIYFDCCKAAGLPASKSFHTLRRSLATAMIVNGVDVNLAAQVLGDRKVNSTKKYIALDSQHLKRCALSFDGITPVRNGGGIE